MNSPRSRSVCRSLLVVVLAVGFVVGVAVPASGSTQSTTRGVSTVHVGRAPDAVAISPDQRWAYVANQSSDSISVVQRSTSSVVATIKVGSEPSSVVFAPGGSLAYVLNYGDHTVSVIATATKKVSASIVLPDGFPMFAAVSPDGSFVNIVSSLGAVDVLSTKTGAARQEYAPSGLLGTLGSATFSADASTAYITFGGNGDGGGTIQAVAASTGAARTLATVETSAAAIAITPDGSKAFVAEGQGDDDLAIVDLKDGSVTHDPLGVPVRDLAISPDGAFLVVETRVDSALLVNVETGGLLATIHVDQRPLQTLFSSDGRRAYVLSSGAFNQTGSVSVIDLATRKLTTTVGLGNQPAAMARSSDGTQLITANSADDTVSLVGVAPAGWRPTAHRIWGSDRYGTAVAISQVYVPEGSQAMTIYVASGTSFPDALSAADVANLGGGPILLTSPTALPTAVANEIVRLQPQFIDVIGGTSAVSDRVFDQLKALGPSTLTRLAGSDRYQTNQAVVCTQFWPGSHPPTVFIATGANYSDSLSASAAASMGADPVVLVPGNNPSLDPGPFAFIQALDSTSFVIAGGTSAVSTGIETQLRTLGTVTREAGVDRYATSEAVNRAAFSHPPSAYFASGSGFADALTGTVLAAGRRSPLYVVPPTCIPAKVESDLALDAIGSITLFGGPGALDANVANAAICP